MATICSPFGEHKKASAMFWEDLLYFLQLMQFFLHLNQQLSQGHYSFPQLVNLLFCGRDTVASSLRLTYLFS